MVISSKGKSDFVMLMVSLVLMVNLIRGDDSYWNINCKSESPNHLITCSVTMLDRPYEW